MSKEIIKTGTKIRYIGILPRNDLTFGRAYVVGKESNQNDRYIEIEMNDAGYRVSVNRDEFSVAMKSSKSASDIFKEKQKWAKSLKEGDKVKFVKGSGDNFTIGKVYTVGGRFHNPDKHEIGVLADDFGNVSGTKLSYFEKAPNSTSSVENAAAEKLAWAKSLKPGSKVVFDPSSSMSRHFDGDTQFIKGKTYVVGGKYFNNNITKLTDSIGVVADSQGKPNGHLVAHFRPERTEMIKSALSKFFKKSG